MTLVIGMPAPWLPDAAPDALVRQLPELPALTRLLRRARRAPEAADWRSGMLAQWQVPAADIAPVTLAAAGLPQLPEGTAVCLAAPVHLVPGISRVHLPPGGWLRPDPGEDEQWCAAFNQEFAATGARLHTVAGGGGWLLQWPAAHAARDGWPETLLGEALQRPVARDQDERSMRRLGTEVEMWLADHALNAARGARQLPPLNAIWFWGGGHVQRLPAWSAPRHIIAAGAPDAWLAGLAQHVRVPVTVAGDWQTAQLEESMGLQSSTVSLAVLSPGTSGATSQYWQQLDEHWFAPLALALQTGRIRELRLQIGRTAWRLPNASALRWFRRRRRAWWQMTGEVRP